VSSFGCQVFAKCKVKMLSILSHGILDMERLTRTYRCSLCCRAGNGEGVEQSECAGDAPYCHA
jgi:hypothetical protein